MQSTHLNASAPLGLPPDLPPLLLAPLHELFGNANPLEVEIGCGKGRFLLRSAQEAPGINFLGIDRVSKWMRVGQKKQERLGLKNLVFLKADIRQVLDELPCAAVNTFHIYFPDPWPKRRHRKRRILTHDFLKLLYSRLEDDGKVEFATDDLDYFWQVKSIVENPGQTLWKQTREAANGRLCRPSIQTHYERKYAAAGRPLYYLELVK